MASETLPNHSSPLSGWSHSYVMATSELVSETGRKMDVTRKQIATTRCFISRAIAASSPPHVTSTSATFLKIAISDVSESSTTAASSFWSEVLV